MTPDRVGRLSGWPLVAISLPGARISPIRLGFRLIGFAIAPHSNGSMMQDGKDKGEGQSARPAKDLRHDRLKLALRENLKRRKSQARGRDDCTIASSGSDDVDPHDVGEKNPGK